MASPAKIGEALIKVLSAKKANQAEIGSRKGVPPPSGFPIPHDPTVNALRTDALSLTGARQHAQEVQGVDPLRKHVNPKNELTDLGEAGNQVMARRGSDSLFEEQPETLLDAMYVKFFRKNGREPTSEEMQDMMRVEEAAMKKRQAQSPQTAPIDNNSLLDEMLF